MLSVAVQLKILHSVQDDNRVAEKAKQNTIKSALTRNPHLHSGHDGADNDPSR